ncbi:MAG: hypothetical protein LBF95_08925, partial [Treponema sp.]|nr:hypothetical protein [Treponema sp.]
EVLMKLSRDEEERAWLLSEYKYAVDTQSKVVQARRDGREEAAAEYAEQIRRLEEEIRRLREER